jgi:SsrA-binding protein
MASNSVIARNKKALHDYHVLEKWEAGIALLGTEVKSLRMGHANLKDSYALIEDGEVFLHQMHIGPYDKGNIFNHDPTRVRKLLLQKRQIKKLDASLQGKGFALVPLSLYWKDNRVKVEIALVRGKRQYDKRDTIARREESRALDRAMKQHLRTIKR